MVKLQIQRMDGPKRSGGPSIRWILALLKRWA